MAAFDCLAAHANAAGDAIVFVSDRDGRSADGE
jgi:hypothetical protein